MSIVLENLTKRYDGFAVVNHLNLDIPSGEFFVLLGTSGSGKTTVLNLIAGLAGVDEGQIQLHGREVTHLPPQGRRVGFVFQNYALFQHMSVAENIDFGPTVHKIPKMERANRREELLELVGLTGLGERLPRQLSGGQQQRVALARALALEPDVLLLDEPLGALDAKIRADLRRNLKGIQRRLGVTTILVTHDQEEAFDLADRIGVMSFGRLLEVGTPQDLYLNPRTEFVASFLGASNLMVADQAGGGIQFGAQHFPLPGEGTEAFLGERRVQVLFRPEDVALGSTPDSLDCPVIGPGEVESISFGGPVERLRLRLPPIQGIRPISPGLPFGSKSILVEASRSPDEAGKLDLRPGDPVWIGVRRIHALANPGISSLIVLNESPSAQYAVDLGGRVARLAHAHVTLLVCDPREPDADGSARQQEIRRQLGDGLASLEVVTSQTDAGTAVAYSVEQRPVDLVVLGFNVDQHMHLVERVLRQGEHHLLLAPAQTQAPPGHILICVASGEPGKEDVQFAGRLAHHLGAEATLMTVLPNEGREETGRRSRAEKFLERGLDSLALLGVKANQVIRTGEVCEQILEEMRAGGCDMLVTGLPLAREDGSISLRGVVQELLGAVRDHPILLVRSNYTGARVYPARGRL